MPVRSLLFHSLLLFNPNVCGHSHIHGLCRGGNLRIRIHAPHDGRVRHSRSCLRIPHHRHEVSVRQALREVYPLFLSALLHCLYQNHPVQA